MTFKVKLRYENMLDRCGMWATVRCMRNEGVAFEDAYAVVFGREPKVSQS
jgi:hypothetical protein